MRRLIQTITALILALSFSANGETRWLELPRVKLNNDTIEQIVRKDIAPYVNKVMKGKPKIVECSKNITEGYLYFELLDGPSQVKCDGIDLKIRDTDPEYMIGYTVVDSVYIIICQSFKDEIKSLSRKNTACLSSCLNLLKFPE